MGWDAGFEAGDLPAGESPSRVGFESRVEGQAMVTEDREYIDRVLSGEKEAFDVLVRKYNRMAGAIAFGIVGDFSSAEDIVQEAFLKSYQGLGSLREPEKFKIWLAGIVRTCALDWMRRRKTSHTVPLSQAFPEARDEGGKGIAMESPPVEELYARRELREKILEAIHDLAREDRIVVTLKHMEGLSYREIAELTGASVSAVESRLFRARMELRKKLIRIIQEWAPPGGGKNS